MLILARLTPIILTLAMVLFALLLQIGGRNLMVLLAVVSVFLTFFAILAVFQEAEEIVHQLSSLPGVLLCILFMVASLAWGYRCIRNRNELYRSLPAVWGVLNAQR